MNGKSLGYHVGWSIWWAFWIGVNIFNPFHTHVNQSWRAVLLMVTVGMFAWSVGDAVNAGREGR